MKIKERESWKAFNEGKGGQKHSFDEFNKAFKGQERNPKVNEFASQGMEEYHHYSERAEYKETYQEIKSKEKSRDTKRSTQNIVKNVAGRVVAVAVGAVITVTTYDAISEQNKIKEPVIASVGWNWNDDYSEATIEFFDEEGNLIKQSLGEITVVTNEATCNQDGSVVYTASVTEKDETYTDSKTVVLKALGHSFDEGQVVVLEDGSMAMLFECERCHEQFTIEISVNEENTDENNE